MAFCQWNPDHILGSDNQDIMCTSCRNRYMRSVHDLVQLNKRLRNRGVPQEMGGQVSYMDFWVYEALNRLASPKTSRAYITAEEMVPIVDRGTSEISKSLNRLEANGKVSLHRDNKRGVRFIEVYEDLDPISVTV